MPTSAPGPSAPVHPEVVRRLLHSEPFRRSRRFAELLDVVTELLPGADAAKVEQYVDELGS